MKGLTSVDISYIQLIAFPFLLFLFYRLSFCGRRIPAPVLLAALLCALCATAFSFTYLPARGGVFLVAKLADDPHEISSRLLRAKISDDAAMLAEHENPAAVRRYFREIASVQEADEFLGGHRDRHALVWGGKRWLNVSLQGRGAKSLEELGVSGAHEWFSGLRLVSGVPAFGLSFNPHNESAGFLAILFSALGGNRHGPALTFSQELYLRDAGEMLARWTSFAHKAFPYLLVGNHHLLQALDPDSYQPGEMRCALRAYSRALSFLRPRDNPYLQAALHNNLGIALFVRHVMEGQTKLGKFPLKQFVLARKAAMARGRFGDSSQAGVEATRNMYAIRSLLKQQKGKVSERKSRKNVLKKRNRK